eukprot:TRINITY_DN7871_c0_g1_i1.p1 TRINITY_DN7871_c0_g1~~TRINITY_DN7871_c0_g1_i1.p1  ORF type:complete len:416 (+),score=54.82 TRINITY_DN7871_c0_g1_i1:87-1334(+)
MDCLPEELRAVILWHVPTADILAHVALVSWSWYRLVSQHHPALSTLWQRVCVHQGLVPSGDHTLPAQEESWFAFLKRSYSWTKGKEHWPATAAGDSGRVALSDIGIVKHLVVVRDWINKRVHAFSRDGLMVSVHWETDTPAHGADAGCIAMAVDPGSQLVLVASSKDHTWGPMVIRGYAVAPELDGGNLVLKFSHTVRATRVGGVLGKIAVDGNLVAVASSSGWLDIYRLSVRADASRSDLGSPKEQYIWKSVSKVDKGYEIADLAIDADRGWYVAVKKRDNLVRVSDIQTDQVLVAFGPRSLPSNNSSSDDATQDWCPVAVALHKASSHLIVADSMHNQLTEWAIDAKSETPINSGDSSDPYAKPTTPQLKARFCRTMPLAGVPRKISINHAGTLLVVSYQTDVHLLPWSPHQN